MKLKNQMDMGKENKERRGSFVLNIFPYLFFGYRFLILSCYYYWDLNAT